MKKGQLIVIGLVVVIIIGGWFVRHRFGVSKKTVPAFIPVEIHQALLPLSDYQKIPQGFPAQMILGTEAKIIDGRTQFLGGATLLQVRAKSPDKAELLLAQYETYFQDFGYSVTATNRNDRVTEIIGTKGKEEIQVGIIKESDGAVLNLKFIATFK